MSSEGEYRALWLGRQRDKLTNIDDCAWWCEQALLYISDTDSPEHEELYAVTDNQVPTIRDC